MKIKLLFATSIFSAALFCACSSEEPIPFENMDTRFEGYGIKLTFNEVEEDDAVVEVKTDEDKPATIVCGSEIQSKVTFLQKAYVLVENDPGFPTSLSHSANYMPTNLVIESKATTYSDRILLSGEKTVYERGNDIVRYSLEGQYSKDKSTPLDINVRREVYKEGLTGKTFEIRFDNQAIEPSCLWFVDEILPNTGLKPTELLPQFCDLISSNFVEKSGFDALRFTFCENGDIEVYAHDVNTGTYVLQDECRSSYQPSSGSRVFIFQDSNWAQSLLGQLSPYTDDCETPLPGGFYDFKMSMPGRRDFSVLSCFISFKEDGRMFIKPVSGLRNHDNSWSFITSWPKRIGFGDIPGVMEHDDLSIAVNRKYIDFDIYFIAHPVD